MLAVTNSLLTRLKVHSTGSNSYPLNVKQFMPGTSVFIPS